MVLRRSVLSVLVSRTLAIAAAVVAAAGVADCAGFAPARDGILSGTLSLATGHTASRISFDDVMSRSGGTYMDRLLADRDSTVERWSDHVERPLLVWIDSLPVITGDQVDYPAAVRAAFHSWSMAGIPLRFAYVASPRQADIRVRWTDHLDHKTGSTTWRTDRAGWLEGSDITLATHISTGAALDERGMHAIALHEVGHALGLSHSADSRDVMAPLVRVDGLSTVDRATIRYLYSLQAGHLR
jgi:predicted Zn-dependent protease